MEVRMDTFFFYYLPRSFLSRIPLYYLKNHSSLPLSKSMWFGVALTPTLWFQKVTPGPDKTHVWHCILFSHDLFLTSQCPSLAFCWDDQSLLPMVTQLAYVKLKLQVNFLAINWGDPGWEYSEDRFLMTWFYTWLQLNLSIYPWSLHYVG